MCCSNSKPIFKGVVVSTAIVLVILLDSAATFRTDDSQISGPYCVFLEKSQELDCVCEEEENNRESENSHRNSQPRLFPSQTYFHLQKNFNRSVAAIKLHSCDKLHLHLDFRSMKRPFHRLRLEDIQTVSIEGIVVIPKDSISIWFRNVNVSVNLSGGLLCRDCTQKVNGSANLNLHLLNTRNIDVRELHTTPNLQAKLQIRDADALQIEDSYFSSLKPNGIEVFNVHNVSILHSEFHDMANSSLVFNRVQDLTIKDSLLIREAVEVLNNATSKVKWECTVSPLVSPNQVMTPEQLSLCSTYGRRSFRSGNSGASSAAGAIILAVVSSVLLLAVIGVLVLLHRTGKLDQYL